MQIFYFVQLLVSTSKNLRKELNYPDLQTSCVGVVNGRMLEVGTSFFDEMPYDLLNILQMSKKNMHKNETNILMYHAWSPT